MDTRPTPEATRREGVRATPIVLADGQAWGFAIPAPRLRPEVVAGVDALGRPIEQVRVVAETGYPLEIRRLIDSLRDACERGPADLRYDALICLALALLRRAHDLDLADAAALLETSLDDLPTLVGMILSVVTGEPTDDRDPSGKEKARG